MLTLVINLDRSADRLTYMQELLKTHKIHFQRINAVDGKKLDPSIVKESTLTPSELGCFKSHVLAWEELLKTDNEYALVLEDDILLSKHTLSFLKNTDLLKLDFDIIKLDTNLTKIFIHKSCELQAKPIALHKLLTIHYGAGGYIIRRNYAEKVVKLCAHPNTPVDVFLFGQENLANNKILQAKPALIMQPIILDNATHFESTIRDERTLKRLENKEKSPLKKLLREVARPFRKIIFQLSLSLSHGRKGKKQSINFLE